MEGTLVWDISPISCTVQFGLTKFACAFIVLITATLAKSQGLDGPVCFSCPNLESPEECRESVTCEASQACSVQQVIGIHGSTYYWSGCEELNLCYDMTNPPTAVGKRQVSATTNRCLYCCTTNLCNNNCSASVNLALHKPAYQSSLYQPLSNHGPPELAVDGNKDLNWFHGSCTHTGQELYPWWAVDLQQTYHISKVKIYHRNDVVSDQRTVHLKILVSNSNATQLVRDSSQFTLCGQYIGRSGDGSIATIKCPVGVTGRWIRIQEDYPTLEYLHMCEVEVFGF